MDDHDEPSSSLRHRPLRNGGSTPAHRHSDNVDDAVSPFISQPYATRRRNKHAFRRVQRVSRHAALTTKQVVWDSNDASIDAALSAVDQVEATYNALRGLLVASFHSAKGFYGAAKDGAAKIEHSFFNPVRDWVLLPAFVGAERATIESIKFFQSAQAKQLAGDSLDLVKKLPFVGENVLAPAMCFSVGYIQRTWEIAKYPIPSKQRVRDTVDFALTGTKWALATAFREVHLYVKRADANITRTLSHTQWKVLGSGPYATLDALSKADVIDHLCERYFSVSEAFGRYELAAHVRAHNRPLYDDLVTTGVLKDRGGDLTEDDEWLLPCPMYRALETPFLLHNDDGQPHDYALSDSTRTEISALWFRLPYVNGKRPGSDAPWVCFQFEEQRDLEKRYRDIVLADGVVCGENREDSVVVEHVPNQNPSIARWYTPDPVLDTYVDQKRHAVSFFLCCHWCRNRISARTPPISPKKLWDVCDDCGGQDNSKALSPFGLAPLSMVMRPTFWRFYGPGHEVRRATWFLDTARHGLQPFDDEAQAVLEDAYLFLTWMSIKKVFNGSASINDALLTVEVSGPDRTTILVQFGSLTHATAIHKGLGAAVALFKRRVYRGAWLRKAQLAVEESVRPQSTIEDSILHAVEESGAFGETIVPDVSLRALLTPRVSQTSMVFHHGPDETSFLAVPSSRLFQADMARFFVDRKEHEPDHLVLIVHGMGEMMRTTDVFGLSLPNLSSIIDCCGFLRKNHVEVQDAQCLNCSGESLGGQVEYLPVEWHEAFSILTQRRTQSDAEKVSGKEDVNVMLSDISLRTIPQMREFANDTLMDVLYFMNPEHHDVIVKVVANEMNVVVQRFRKLTGFEGHVSVIGHSLGSIICWDILDNQRPEFPTEIANLQVTVPMHSSVGSFDSQSGYGTATSEISEQSDVSNDLCVPSPLYPQLDFFVQNLFLLGSPVAVFLMIRNQRAPLKEQFYLRGCRRVFNIFHPYDPVAYRVEPCIDPRNADFEPMIVRHWSGGLRVKYKTQRFFRQLMEKTWKTQQDVVEAFEAGMAGMGLLNSSVDTSGEDDALSVMSSDDHSTIQVKTGSLNRGRRIDYLLQEKEIESANEYVSALAAHSSYWTEKDLSLFVARQISRSDSERGVPSEL
jgi:hypothetical protein